MRITTRPYPIRSFEKLCKSGIHRVLARIYAARGINDIEELDNNLDTLIPPHRLLKVNVAANFLADVIAAKRKIVIVADYDCDGATACAVGIRGLRLFGANVDFIVPNRFENGYGLTPEIVKLIAIERSPDVIITVDNGISSIDGVAEATRRGIEVLITDHHLSLGTLPAARAIVNPNQPECKFPSKNLAGVGVIFYVLLALRMELRKRSVFDIQNQPRLDTLLDLVALGTVADSVKLDANNRVLVKHGLQRIRSGTMSAGIAALFHISNREFQRATSLDLGFLIGPRLNAAGRLADMSLGIECLITDDKEQAWTLAKKLDSINFERRDIESSMRDSALTLLDNFDPQENTTISILDNSWHQGVIGIIASRIKDKFYRPTIAFATGSESFLKGSGRSIPEFHLRDALDRISKYEPHLIQSFGGHAMAAGLTIRTEDFSAFSKIFEKVGREYLGGNQLENVLETDGFLENSYYKAQFIELLNNKVWGQSFQLPLFFNEFLIIHQRILKDKHLELLLGKNGEQYNAIWFGHTDRLGKKAKIVFRLDTSKYKGVTKVQLLIQHAETI